MEEEWKGLSTTAWPGGVPMSGILGSGYGWGWGGRMGQVTLRQEVVRERQAHAHIRTHTGEAGADAGGALLRSATRWDPVLALPLLPQLADYLDISLPTRPRALLIYPLSSNLLSTYFRRFWSSSGPTETKGKGRGATGGWWSRWWCARQTGTRATADLRP